MGKRKMQGYSNRNIRMLIPIFILCISVCALAGCSSQNNANATVQDEKDPSAKEAGAGNMEKEQSENKETQTKETQTEDNSQVSAQDEDMVPSPLDLEKLDTANKIEESGISYYNLHTGRQTPLPIDEWAKLELISEKGAVIPAYIRFTNVTRDTEKIEKHMKQYMEANNIKATFNPQPLNTSEEYAMMDYEILIGKEASMDKDDYISFSAVRFPLQLYSTMRSGKFGDQAEADTERFVSDVSVYDTNTPLTSGSMLQKTVICSVPKAYTAYGIIIPYMHTQGNSQYLYYKLEY